MDKEQREEGGESRLSGQVGGWSNKQRLYNLEHGQVDNVANSERMRNDLYELTCKVARMAQTMENMQNRQYAKEKAQTYEKAKENLDRYAGGGIRDRPSERRQTPRSARRR